MGSQKMIGKMLFPVDIMIGSDHIGMVRQEEPR